MTGGTARRIVGGMADSNRADPLSRRAPTPVPHSALSRGPGGWLVVAVVAGLFAMHGLGMHGLHSDQAPSSMHSASSSNVGTSGPDTSMAKVSASGMTATGHGDGAAAQAEPPPIDLGAAPPGSATGTSHKPSGGAVLLGMCLTLLAFGVLWLRRWITGRPAWTIPRHALGARIAQLPVTARDLSPPLRAELSIWRC